MNAIAPFCLRSWTIALALCALLPLPGQAQTANKFALIGDLGYRPTEELLVQNVLDDINKASLDFVVHLGDLSSPRFACTDEHLAKRFAQFNDSAHPFVFTPGDNDWTDCHDGQNIKGGDPLERLTALRKIFFQGEQSLGRRTMPLTRQSQNPVFSARTPAGA
jgi:hypothetical protein